MGDEREISQRQGSSEVKAPTEDVSVPNRSPAQQHSSVGSHRRSISGTLAAFLTGHSGQAPEHLMSGNASTEAEDAAPGGTRLGGISTSSAQKTSMRRRRGSLRKTALLGTGKLRIDNRERRASSLEEVKVMEGEQSDGSGTDSGTLSTPISPVTPIDMSTPRPLLVPPPVPMVTHPVHGDPSKILASQEIRPFGALHRPSTAQSTASTTTEEDDSPTSPDILPPSALLKLPVSLDSYFPQQLRAPRAQQTSPKSPSPLAALPPSIPSAPPTEWDYSETRWWGWIILIVTWVIFVVGMGSCFEVWSWAWDVGETPYAPPELEDDPTLPIVGYYPALIILTSVMAWVWVTVAWVGMKYFKHANISGDE